MLDGFSSLALRQLKTAIGTPAPAAQMQIAPPPVIIDFSQLSEELARISGELGEITDHLHNPDAVAGDEKCRKGVLAIQHQWFADAEPELLASIELYRFRSLPHLLMGICRIALGDAAGAYTYMESAVRYGCDHEQEAGVTAALLGSAALDGAGRTDLALNLLREASSLGTCVEVLAGLALHGDGPAVTPTLLGLMESNPNAFHAEFPAGELLGDAYQERLERARPNYDALLLDLRADVETAGRVLAALTAVPPIVLSADSAEDRRWRTIAQDSSRHRSRPITAADYLEAQVVYTRTGGSSHVKEVLAQANRAVDEYMAVVHELQQVSATTIPDDSVSRTLWSMVAEWQRLASLPQRLSDLFERVRSLSPSSSRTRAALRELDGPLRSVRRKGLPSRSDWQQARILLIDELDRLGQSLEHVDATTAAAAAALTGWERRGDGWSAQPLTPVTLIWPMGSVPLAPSAYSRRGHPE